VSSRQYRHNRPTMSNTLLTLTDQSRSWFSAVPRAVSCSELMNRPVGARVLERAASHRQYPEAPPPTPLRSPGDGARSDVENSRLPLAVRTTGAVPTLIMFDVSTARMSLARLESLRAVHRHVVDSSGFAAVNRLRRLCQGAYLITAAAENHCLAGPALRACPLDVPVGFLKLRRNHNTHIRRTRKCRRG
jgi:hypothetical protein